MVPPGRWERPRNDGLSRKHPQSRSWRLEMERGEYELQAAESNPDHKPNTV